MSDTRPDTRPPGLDQLLGHVAAAIAAEEPAAPRCAAIRYPAPYDEPEPSDGSPGWWCGSGGTSAPLPSAAEVIDAIADLRRRGAEVRQPHRFTTGRTGPDAGCCHVCGKPAGAGPHHGRGEGCACVARGATAQVCAVEAFRASRAAIDLSRAADTEPLCICACHDEEPDDDLEPVDDEPEPSDGSPCGFTLDNPAADAMELTASGLCVGWADPDHRIADTLHAVRFTGDPTGED